MLRHVTIASLLRSLLLGAAAVGATVVTTGTVVGCADENDPVTWVKRLEDPRLRAQAIKRLIQFFEDAMTRDNKDREGPTVKPLLDKIIEPLSDTYVNGDLDERTKSELIKFLADTRDARAAKAYESALKSYKPDSTDMDVKWVARAVKGMKLKSAAGPLFEAYEKVQASKPKGNQIYRDVYDAMVELKDPSWEQRLIAKLNVEMPDPQKDADKQTAAMRRLDQEFWQTCAAHILGLLRSESAITPLIKIVLSPTKGGGLQTTAINALVKIGKPVQAPAIQLLRGESKDLIEYSRLQCTNAGLDKKIAETAHISSAAAILGYIGRSEAEPVMRDVISKSDDLTKVIVARELVKLPTTPDLVKLFQEVTEKTPNDLNLPGGAGNAKAVLVEASGGFFDASFVPWLVKLATTTKGSDDDLLGLRETSTLTAMKLMKKDQVKDVEGLMGKWGKSMNKEFNVAKEVVEKCGDQLSCYFGILEDPNTQTDSNQFKGIKAAYMSGVLGKDDTRQQLFNRLPKISHPAIRFVTGLVIDRHAPKGDAKLADDLEKLIQQNKESLDDKKIQADAPLNQVMYRLTARAQ